jgi:predicted phage tail protein
MKRNVKLYGSLAIDAGVDQLELDANHSAMLFRGLQCRIPEFRKIASAHKKLMIVGTKKTNEKIEVVKSKDLMQPFADCDTIHVMPETEGDISEAFWAVAVAVVDTVGETAALYIAAAVVIVGVVAIMYGESVLAQALAPKPKTGSGTSNPSFIFSGPTNATSQGGAIPIIYGTCLVGSTIIASNYQTIEVPIGTVANTHGIGGGGHF